MLKSKSIADFVPVKITELRVGEPIAVDLHLFFQANNHVLIWRVAGSVLTTELLSRYQSRGLETLWVHKTDWPAFQVQLGTPLEQPDYGSGTKSPAPAQTGDFVYVPKVTAKKLLDIIQDSEKTEREKTALIAKSSRELLGDLASPSDREKQVPVSHGVARTIHEFLIEITQDARAMTNQIWAISELEPELDHGVNVSTLAVLFSMAFGNTDQNLLADIGVAGLLHDIGLCQIPYQSSQVAWEAQSSEQKAHALGHPEQTVHLIMTYAPEVSNRAKQLLRNHHGVFSEAKHIQTETELGQFIAMADVVDSMCNGLWDGARRTVLESLLTLEARETALGESRQFNQGIFTAVMRWIRGNIPDHSLQRAIETVGRQLESVRDKAS